MKQILKISSTIILSALLLLAHTQSSQAANGIYFNNQMIAGKTINYWIAPGCEYTVTIPRAVNKLIYPPYGWWNPMMLYRTTTQSSSKMDFHQQLNKGNAVASTQVYRPNEKTPLPIPQWDQYHWQWAKITINDFLMSSLSNDMKDHVILHEMGHAYGAAHSTSTSSIMFPDLTNRSAVLTGDLNDLLINKYNY